MAETAAELAALFGMEVPEEEPAKVTPQATDKSKEEVSGEGTGQPSGVAAPEEPTGEATSEPKAETPSEDTRYDELLTELKRYRRYDPIIQMFEEEPELARQVAARRFAPETQEVQAPAQAPAQPQAISQEKMNEIRAYWERRMTEDPIGGLAEFIDRLVDERTTGTRVTGVKALIRNYKADRKAEDPLFAKYESVFDALVNRADVKALQDDPDTAFAAIENLAYGTWARQQRAALARAKAVNAAPPKRETPQTLATSTTTAPASGGAKPKQELSAEERYLADVYGEDLVGPDESEESVWGR